MQLAEVRQRFFSQLHDVITASLDSELARRLDAFSRLFYETASLDDLKNHRIRDIYGAVFGSWSFIQEFDERTPKLRLFNPDFEKHGWQGNNTVLALLIRDIPFAIDSIRLELNARDIAIRTVHGVKLRVLRDASGQLLQLVSANDKTRIEGSHIEALYQLEIGRCGEGRELRELTAALTAVLDDVEMVVDDFQQMRSQLEKLEADIAGWSKFVGSEEHDEGTHFLRWLHNNHFTFLGVEALQVSYDAGGPHVQRVVGSERGLLKRRATSGVSDLVRELSLLDTDGKTSLESLITFTKSSVRSRVHRRAHPDYIAVRILDDKGRIVRVVRFLGLFTSATYTTSATSIPLVRQKVVSLLDRAGVNMEAHEGKSLLRVIETFPRDELFLAPVDELFRIITAVHAIAERKQVRLFLRGNAASKFYSCFVYTPKDIYNTELREKIQGILAEALNAVESEFNTYFSESVLTRVHFIFRVDEDSPNNVEEAELEQQVIRAAKSWENMLGEFLIEEFGEERGIFYAHLYNRAFPPGYQHDFDPRVGVSDIKAIRGLDNEHDIGLSLYRIMEDNANVVRFRLFHIGEPLILSDIMPILENLGLRAVGERPYGIVRHDRLRIWIHEFTLIYGLADQIDIGVVKEKFQEAFLRVWHGDADSDSFNRLVLGTRLDWRDVAMLRAYARYMKQINVKFGIEFIAEALSHHLGIAQLLAEFFSSRFDPHGVDAAVDRSAYSRGLQERIITALDKVENLSEDRAIRAYLELMQATLRTNFFARDAGKFKPCMTFKFNPAMITDMPLPRPMFEIFVYSPRVEGVHLRRGKVARGGLRWSDRLEDYRTEVLGLVKAQQVKNAVIVPVGAKGGFICKRMHKNASREEVQAEGIACYQIFVRGILDLTDNLVGDAVVPPADVRRFDDDDYYLVVAADKGTASFSDIANAISAEYNFWLGDAFASGGSIGYDHKKIGITARGGWVSVERNFRERGLNTRTTDFTVVGIGDMSGDVFGNGMLRSEHIRLVAAFDHRHIFVDPEPDAKASFIERQRLFALPRSSWADYNSTLISKGGGVFSRGVKSIAISDEMQRIFNIAQQQLAPTELISAILRAPVDLIWNGGIGTYIKARRESHADAGDKSNDSLRVDAADVKARVIGEGGNLGMTQLARIEYALHGGALNTDFIDNSAGVDCSDHEVNIKILLNDIVSRGDLTEKQRRELLVQMRDDVADLVLQNNYRQTQAISIAAYEALMRAGEYRRLISSLEAGGHLSRTLEFIPDDDTLTERRVQKQALTRPELSILIAYVKGLLKQELAASSLPDDPYISRIITTAFPAVLGERYPQEMKRHRLRREIIATQAANDMVNRMGINFVERMRASTGYGSADVTRAYITARDIFGMQILWDEVEALDNSIGNDLQLQLFSEITRLIRRASRWFLRNRRSIIDPSVEVPRFFDSIAAFQGTLGDMLPESAALRFTARCEQLEDQGVPQQLAKVVAGAASLYSMLGIVEATQHSGAELNDVARVYFRLGDVLDLDWFAKQIADLHIDSHWQALARESFRDDLEWQQRSLTVGVLKHMQSTNDTESALTLWLESQASMVERWRLMLNDLHNAQTQDFAMYSVAVRELLDLAQSSSHCP